MPTIRRHLARASFRRSRRMRLKTRGFTPSIGRVVCHAVRIGIVYVLREPICAVLRLWQRLGAPRTGTAIFWLRCVAMSILDRLGSTTRHIAKHRTRLYYRIRNAFGPIVEREA